MTDLTDAELDEVTAHPDGALADAPSTVLSLALEVKRLRAENAELRATLASPFRGAPTVAEEPADEPEPIL